MPRPKGSLDKTTYANLDTLASYMRDRASATTADGRKIWMSETPVKDITDLFAVSHWSARRYLEMLCAARRAERVGQGAYALTDETDTSTN